MCLILFAIEQHQDFPFIAIANRDEFYARPTRSAHWWDDHHHIFAGRDLQAQGTWMGVNRRGRFAAVTNVREPGVTAIAELSRGHLPGNFLVGDLSAQDYLEQLQSELTRYAGFNLLLGDSSGFWFCSNRQSGISKIPAGIYGISNGRFDEAWPKLESGKQQLHKILQTEFDSGQLMQILTDDNPAADELLPSTGVTLKLERMLSSRFIRSDEYGTRAATLLRFSSNNNVSFTEQNFDSSGALGDPVNETFEIGI